MKVSGEWEVMTANIVQANDIGAEYNRIAFGSE
jgi:hypothetical protein